MTALRWMQGCIRRFLNAKIEVLLIVDYLAGKITKEEYLTIAQEYMTLHGENLIDGNYKTVRSTI